MTSKEITSAIVGFAFGIFGTLLTIYIVEEKLQYTLSPPIEFNNTYSQEINLTNNGWNPAENIIFLIKHNPISTEQIKTDNKEIELEGSEGLVQIKLKRLRRSETIKISMQLSSYPMEKHGIKIKSDRSIAVNTN